MTTKTRVASLVLLAFLALPVLAVEQETGLKVGDKAPDIHRLDIKGKSFDLATAETAGPVVIVFYRGGWCPFCNLQLHDLQINLVPFAKDHHAQIVAISVDKTTEEAKTQAKHDLTMAIISDTKAELLTAYHVRNQISPELYEKYKTEYKLDLEESSGEKHHIIAVPAVYIVDPHGTIIYAHVDSNYKVRAPLSEIKDAIVKAQK